MHAVVLEFVGIKTDSTKRLSYKDIAFLIVPSLLFWNLSILM